ncbi:MAG TPA: hypothetical protein VMQ76_01220 [Terracidiphilus sp.]|jgi:hypothetical protein|nr:hypothetical protein [Terracidiphilus sp.]
MVSSILRTKSVTTKVTESEYGRLEELASASGVNLSEWIRGKLLGADRAGGEAGVVLEEVLALRTILVNLLVALGKGEPMTHEQMQGLIERADGGKTKRALERLAAAVPESAPENQGEAETEAKTEA